MAEILYMPNRERLVTSNVWALLHWLRTTRRVELADWTALQRWSVSDPAAFRAAIAAFARLPDAPVRLAPDPLPVSWPGLARRPTAPLRAAGDDVDGRATSGHDTSQLLHRQWSPASLIRPLADVLLHADLRPDDRVVVYGPPWPWLAALLEGTTVILGAAADLLETAADEHATVLVAPAQALAEIAFRRARRRPNLASLRTIIATGGPLSPEGRRRIYTWVKADLMLLARTGDTFWGNPLEPVLAQPAATPAFLTPPASAPAPP